MKKTIENARSLWTKLSDIPVTDDGDIEEVFLSFPIGTDREEIWHWFEETFDCSVHDDLMFPEK